MIDTGSLMQVAVQAAVAGGEAIMQVYDNGDFQVTSKEDDSPLTLADRKAHDVITDILKESNLPLLSEEGKHIDYKIRKAHEYFWLVDPLDGTKEFIKRNGEFTVNIALIKKDEPVIGVIYVPVTKVLYFANIDIGAFKIETYEAYMLNDVNPLFSYAQTLPVSSFDNNVRVVGSRSHLSSETIQYIQKLKNEYGHLDFVSIGSSLKLCLIAEGSADLYPRFGPTMEWDIAAGHAIVKASGGILTQIDGSNLNYNKENLLNPDFIAKSKFMNNDNEKS